MNNAEFELKSLFHVTYIFDFNGYLSAIINVRRADSSLPHQGCEDLKTFLVPFRRRPR